MSHQSSSWWRNSLQAGWNLGVNGTYVRSRGADATSNIEISLRLGVATKRPLSSGLCRLDGGRLIAMTKKRPFNEVPVAFLRELFDPNFALSVKNQQ
jgi:hypothetical protein